MQNIKPALLIIMTIFSMNTINTRMLVGAPVRVTVYGNDGKSFRVRIHGGIGPDARREELRKAIGKKLMINPSIIRITEAHGIIKYEV